MNKRYFLLVLFFLLLSVGQALPSGMLTYTFDDGGITTLDAFAIMQKYNQVGVSGPIIFGTYFAPSTCMSPQDLLTLQTNGWEIASHTVNHPYLTQIPFRYDNEFLSGWSLVSGKTKTYQTGYNYTALPFILQDGDILNFDNSGNLLRKVPSMDAVENVPGSYFFDSSNRTIYLHTTDGTDPNNHTIRTSSVERELCQSKTEFEKMGLRINTVVLPYGNWNPEIVALASNFYNAIVPGIGGYNNLPYDAYHLKRIGVADNTEVSQMKIWVEEAIANNDWLIINFHNIGDAFFSKEKFDEFVAWINITDIEVVTIMEGLGAAHVPLPASFWFFSFGLGSLAVYKFRRKSRGKGGYEILMFRGNKMT